MKGKVALHNLGCKVNAYETEAMQQMLEAAGYEIVPFEPGADIYVINTCTVTNIADRKSRQMLHKAKKMNPDAIVVAAGCYVQADTKKAEADASIESIIKNNKKQELISILENYRSDQQKTTECVDINHTKEYEITKQGLRRWKKKNGRIKAYYCPQGMTLRKGAYVDNIEEDAAIVFC